MKDINDIALIIPARVNSTRVIKKMIRPFGDITLFENAINILINTSIIPNENIYLAIGDEELTNIGKKYLNNKINIFYRTKKSVNTDGFLINCDQTTNWFDSLSKKYKYFMILNACQPFIKSNSIENFINYFLKSNSNNGGLFYYEGSNNLGFVEHMPSNKPGTSQTVKDIEVLKNYKKVCFDLKPGDIVVHHIHTIHGSDENKSTNPRRVFTIQCYGKSDKCNYEKKKKYLIELKKQLIDRGQEENDGILIHEHAATDGFVQKEPYFF